LQIFKITFPEAEDYLTPSKSCLV